MILRRLWTTETMRISQFEGRLTHVVPLKNSTAYRTAQLRNTISSSGVPKPGRRNISLSGTVASCAQCEKSGFSGVSAE
jgi:hypothetical protein